MAGDALDVGRLLDRVRSGAISQSQAVREIESANLPKVVVESLIALIGTIATVAALASTPITGPAGALSASATFTGTYAALGNLYDELTSEAGKVVARELAVQAQTLNAFASFFDEAAEVAVQREFIENMTNPESLLRQVRQAQTVNSLFKQGLVLANSGVASINSASLSASVLGTDELVVAAFAKLKGLEKAGPLVRTPFSLIEGFDALSRAARNLEDPGELRNAQVRIIKAVDLFRDQNEKDFLRQKAENPAAFEFIESVRSMVELQSGGPLGANQLALVGEAGPELFVPKTAGDVLNNEDTMTVLAAAGARMLQEGTTDLASLAGEGDGGLFGPIFGTDADGKPLTPDAILEQVATVFSGIAEIKASFGEESGAAGGGEEGAGEEGEGGGGGGLIGNLFGTDEEGKALTPEGILEQAEAVREGLAEQKELFGEIFGPEAAAGLELAEAGFGILGNLFGTDEEGLPLTPEGLFEQVGTTFDDLFGLKEEKNDEELSQSEEHQKALTDEEKKAQEERKKNAIEAAAGALGITSSLQSASESLMSSGSKKAFQIGKALALSNAVVGIASGVANAVGKAMEAGPILGPILAGVNSALVITSGIQQINAIKARQFNSGGATVPRPSIGGGAPALPTPGTPSTPTLPVGQQPEIRERSVSIVLDSDRGVVSTEWVRDQLIPTINDAIGDGVVLNVQNT